jgi:predicted nucleotidyltransferase
MKNKLRVIPLMPFEDVNAILQFFVEKVPPIFGENLVGVYLTGSLSYNAFDYDTSDIDLTVILKTPISASELSAVKQLHTQLERQFEKWSKRLECSYTPLEMLPSLLPPDKPRPWYWGGDGILYEEAPYGNEWIINKYLLWHHAIPLVGPNFKELTDTVDIAEVQKACIRDLFAEWEPKKRDPGWFRNDSHYESYFILNLCRILYTVMCGAAGSKQTAAAWVKSHYGQPWAELVGAAESWHYGLGLNLREKALQFLDFVIGEISGTELYKGSK